MTPKKVEEAKLKLPFSKYFMQSLGVTKRN